MRSPLKSVPAELRRDSVASLKADEVASQAAAKLTAAGAADCLEEALCKTYPERQAPSKWVTQRRSWQAV